MSTLSLQEAQSSSEIENVIPTQDALYKYQIQPQTADPVSKEVAHYADGLETGFQQVRDNNNWEHWLVYMLRGVAVTARHTSGLVQSIGLLLSGCVGAGWHTQQASAGPGKLLH